MSGAVMLLMAATVGITYGWTPDGGDGVKYIIQIPPDKMEQVAHSGEISSQIPAEIRGHVSEVVIRVGDGKVPRVTPRRFSSRGTPANPSFAADQIPIPIPSMGDPTDLRPIGPSRTASTAMMKPAPQSGGMNMPGGFGMTPASNSGAGIGSSAPATTGYGGAGYANAPPPNTGSHSSGLEQATRDVTNNVAKQFNATTEATRQQIQQDFNATAGRLGDAANAQMQSVSNSVRDATNGLLYGPVPPPSTSDNPRMRLTQDGSSARPSPTNPSASNAPSTAPYTGSASSRTGYANAPSSTETTSSPERVTPPSFTSSPPSNNAPSRSSNAANSRTVSTPPLNATTRDEDWYALQNGTPQRPSTAPQNNSTSRFAGGNFAQLPEGLQPDANSSTNRSGQTGSQSDFANSDSVDGSRRNSPINTDLDYDPNLSRAQAAALPKNGYSYDAEGYPVDRQGYRVDRYGRRVDRQGNLLAAAGARSDENSGESARNRYSDSANAGGTSYPNGRAPQNSSTPPLMQPPRDRITESRQEADRYSSDPGRQSAEMTRNNPRNSGGMDWGDERPRQSEDAMASASDGPSRSSRFAERDTAPVGGSGESVEAVEQVAAQPIFNALLLLSVVGNVYLLFWLKNLRVQFRDMVAAKRASATGGSLATGI